MSRVIEITDARIITPPAVPAMAVAHAKKHLKALTGAEDDLILSWIYGATDYIERQTGRQIITATREATLKMFPMCRGQIQIPRPPLQEVLSVSYVSSDGTVVEFDDGGSPATPLYSVHLKGLKSDRGYIEPLYGVEWPTPRCESEAVRIQYRCGYGDSPSDIPPMLSGLLGFLVSTYDQVRDVTRQSSSGQPMEYPQWVKNQISDLMLTAGSTIQMLGLDTWV